MSDLLQQEECLSKKSKQKKKKRKHSSSPDDVNDHSEKQTRDMNHQTETTKSSIYEDITDNSSVRRKKKKRKGNSECHTSECNRTIGDENNVQEILSENINTLTEKMETEYFPKKKKKCKKKNGDATDRDVMECVSENGENVQNTKMSDKTVCSPDCQESSSKPRQESNPKSDSLSSKDKKHKKHKKHANSAKEEGDQCVDMSEDSVLHLSVAEKDNCHKEKKRKYKKDKSLEVDVKTSEDPLECEDVGEIEKVETNGDRDEIKTKRKKKKKHKEFKNGDENLTSQVCDSAVTLDREVSGNISSVSEKKKKDKHKRFENGDKNLTSEAADSSVIMDEEANDNISSVSKKKKKKKKKKSRMDLECDESVTNDTQATDDSSTGPKKSKKKKKKLTEADKMKKSEISEHQKTETEFQISDGQAHDDSKINSNTCNGESQSGHSSALSLGQWQTASLGDNDRQQKFLRLLGGFKKGGSKGPFGNPCVKPKGGNLALSHTEEEVLTKNLMTSFQKALDYKLNMGKGVGLGFTPPPGEGKKFHVDTNAIKSKKFDD